jgi:hypothetical protein
LTASYQDDVGGTQEISINADQLKIANDYGLDYNRLAITHTSIIREHGDTHSEAGLAGQTWNYSFPDKSGTFALTSEVNEVSERLDAFLSDDVQVDDVVDTLVEIRKYMTDDTAAFTQLSNKVSAIEDGTTKVPEAVNADTVDGKHASDFDAAGAAATAEANAKAYTDEKTFGLDRRAVEGETDPAFDTVRLSGYGVELEAGSNGINLVSNYVNIESDSATINGKEIALKNDITALPI